MVEMSVEEYSGGFNRTELWKKLQKKVMRQTYLVILNYLQSIDKIAISKEGLFLEIHKSKGLIRSKINLIYGNNDRYN